MPKVWWILPVVVAGLALWLWGGWTVYQVVQGSSGQHAEQPKPEAWAPAMGPSQRLAAQDS